MRCSYCMKEVSSGMSISDSETLSEHDICMECYTDIYELENFNMKGGLNG